MGHQTALAILVTSAGGYTMLLGGLRKRMLRISPRGRCRHCGRLRVVCSCRRAR